MQTAEVIARRQRDLFQKDLVTSGRVGEAEAQVEKVRVLTQESRRLLAMGAIMHNGDGSYSLTAPKDGRIVEIRSTPGAALQAMDAAVLVDTSEELWLRGLYGPFLSTRLVHFYAAIWHILPPPLTLLQSGAPALVS